jgi:hypothetical protein
MLRLIVILIALLGVTFAQDTSTNLNDLRYEAFRLTLESKIAELPTNLQSEARDLLSRAETLREPLMELRTKMLESYVAELQKGQPTYLAWATARNTVADERLALLPEVVPLLRDIRDFVRDNPEVAPVFKALREQFREDSPRFR